MMREMLETIPLEDLFDFLVDYAKRKSDFENEFNVRFADPDFATETKKITDWTKSIIDSSNVDDYDYRGKQGDIVIDTHEIFDEMKRRIEQGYFRLAFAGLEIIFGKIQDFIEEYQDEHWRLDQLYEEVQTCIALMTDVAEKVIDDSDRSSIYERCLTLAETNASNDNVDYCENFLDLACMLVTTENRASLESTLEEIDSEWRTDQWMKGRLKILEQLEEKETIGKSDDGHSNEEFRDSVFFDTMKQGFFADAEDLCIAILEEEENEDYITKWTKNLFSVYEKNNEIDRLEETAEILIQKGFTDYYDKFKSHLETLEIWADEYAQLLEKCAAKLPF